MQRRLARLCGEAVRLRAGTTVKNQAMAGRTARYRQVVTPTGLKSGSEVSDAEPVPLVSGGRDDRR